MKPIEIWKPTLRKLPRRAWLVWSMGWGVWGIFCAMVLIGGVRYSSMFDDWGFEKPAQANLVQAIVDKARQDSEEGADNMEDALNDFVGEEGEEEDLDALPNTDCLIIGYEPGGIDGFSSILLASVVGSELKYVAKIPVERIPIHVREELLHRMPLLERKTSFVKTPFAKAKTKGKGGTRWLEPKLMCRVAFTDWSRSNRLIKPRFRNLLSDVN